MLKTTTLMPLKIWGYIKPNWQINAVKQVTTSGYKPGEGSSVGKYVDIMLIKLFCSNQPKKSPKIKVNMVV